MLQRAATFDDKIFKKLKGKPAAKVLGLDVPWFLQESADEVIE